MSAPPFNTTAGFLARFVAPLLGGGPVEVEAPLSAHDRAAMLSDPSPLSDPAFLHLRHRAAQRLVADPELPDPQADELSSWLGLHDVLALDHPDTQRVWTRGATWDRVETETRSLLAFARPTQMADAFSRHIAVDAFLNLRREDEVVDLPEGELRFRGQTAAKRRFGLFAGLPADMRPENVLWIEQPHAAVVDRLLPDLMWVSPLTSLVRPRWAPRGWSPLITAAFLRSRAHARAICHAWASDPQWLRSGGIVAGSLLISLACHRQIFGEAVGPTIPGVSPLLAPVSETGPPDSAGPDATEDGEDSEEERLALPSAELSKEPEDVGAVVAALIHLHVLKVLEFDARIGLGIGARDWAVQAFLAMPLLLEALEPALGRPFELPRESFAQRWEEYRDHLSGLVPKPIVEKLLATLRRRIVERHPA